MEGFYHLRGRTPGPVWHYAKVSLRLEMASEDTIVIADDAFRGREFPDAPEVAQFKAEAIDGVRDALAALSAGRPPYRVTVTVIDDAPFDTSPGDVRLATMRATGNALATIG